ncbi:MAG TPA: hypothetical protein VGR07_11935, partial [Thermoanaerobaculia bacterium]|nr:hypothetical protein [Thermoanaerobaculia bacterium]
MSTSAEREPRLTAQNEDFKCGYGPRSIRLSLDRKTVFVGCKDGSVTKIDLDQAAQGRADAMTPLCPAGVTCIRSLCDLDNRWLLLGQDDGRLSVLRWDEPGQPVAAAIQPPAGAGGVGYVGRWDSGLFLVSPRHCAALLLGLEPRGPAESGGFTLVRRGQLDGVLAISGFARTGPDERWIVCKDGSLWRCEKRELKPLGDLWQDSGFERPGYVYDIAVIRRDPAEGYDLGAYLSTDEGVFLLRRTAPEATSLCLDSIYLPGITDTCLAITHAVQGERCFFWVSDVEGRVHLFWCAAGQLQLDERPVWKRSGLLEGRFPVRRALASWSPGEGHEAVVSQACRDDRIVVSWYRSEKPGEPKVEKDAAELLSWGKIDELPAGEEMAGWCDEARVADQIEATGRDPEQLRRFLRNPGIELAFSTLEKILATGASRRAGDAVTLWTHTLIGTVHRRLKPPATQDYLGIIRWLRRLGEELARRPGDGTPDLRNRIEDNILYARRWGVFGSTYGTRQHVLNALEPLSDPPSSGQATPERELDRLVYESLIFRRRMDLEEVLPPPASYDLAPWELQYLDHDGSGEGKGAGEYVAVSWDDGGTVYRRNAGETAWQDLTAGPDGTPKRRRPLGRRILLGTCDAGAGPRPFLLSAPAHEDKEKKKKEEEIELRFADEDLRTVPAWRLKVAALAAGGIGGVGGGPESVYGLLDLGFGRVVVGLEGTTGMARIGLLAVTPKGELRALQAMRKVPFPTIYPESKTELRNPVWALDLYSGSPGEAVLFLGCGDGQIWKLRLRFPGDDTFEMALPIAVGRLGTPVSALACRTVEGEKEGPPRVFAGGADGTLVAFQALGDWNGDQERYATLWATREQGPVQRILTLTSPLVVDPKGPEIGDADVQHLVLAVTQAGRGVFFLDRPRVERRDSADTLQRLKVPGER